MTPKTAKQFRELQTLGNLSSEDALEILDLASHFDEQAGPLKLGAQAGDEPTTSRRFKVTASSGKPFYHGFWGNFAVDFDGMEIPRQDMPFIEDHRDSIRLGATDKIGITKDRRLEAVGFFLARNPDSIRVQRDLEDGFPMQASIYVPPLGGWEGIEEVKAGKTAQVNGHELKGPGHIFRRSTLREVTATSLGADDQTFAEALSARCRKSSKLQHQEPEPMNKKEDNPNLGAMTVDRLRADFPELVKALEATSFAAGETAGETAERARASDIIEACEGRDTKLGAKHLADGSPVVDAPKAVLKEGAALRTNRLEEIRTEGETAAVESVEHQLNASGDPTPEELAAMSVEDRVEAEWSPEIASEFGAKDVYAAYLAQTQA